LVRIGNQTEYAERSTGALKRGRNKKVRPTEELLELLHDEGYLELPERRSAEGDMFAFIRPSEAARAIGERARQQVLSRLGLSDAGAYIARERQSIGIKPKEISQKIKIAQQALHEVEIGKLPLYELTARKVVDLVELLNLNPEIILLFLRGLDPSRLREEQSASLLRADKKLDKDQWAELEKMALDIDQERTGKQERLERFIQDFVTEISKRGLSA
jgi:transcriptional regulator with XRE-family HTH domain